MNELANVGKQTLQTKRTTLVRRPQRGMYDFASVAAILDEAFLCHIGFVMDGQPYVLPTAFGREGRLLYFHGHVDNHMLNVIAGGVPVCFTAMILDGFVLAKSAFRHSMNYRSVVVLGRPQLVPKSEKRHALEVIVNHIIPGRWEDVRVPNEEELDATIVVKLAIEEASAKVRTGPPVDLDIDRGSGVWSGVIPVTQTYQAPQPPADCAATVSPPGYAVNYVRPGKR